MRCFTATTQPNSLAVVEPNICSFRLNAIVCLIIDEEMVKRTTLNSITDLLIGEYMIIHAIILNCIVGLITGGYKIIQWTI